ncbi:UPF0262 family protein [Rhizobium sp. 1AS11]|uniref:UPF0262 family protein n=1 Tax=Rhizobium acaciae TaxID=2989736 RepID=UPI002223C3DD|nr:UPF0262 family protein [Rhizobium acaciae]MCW1410691.1 UPF0262 family protein [Rhizobium acaciae]MCW1743010.1 UPF0262 family protein [Rhizobium acaciae]
MKAATVLTASPPGARICAVSLDGSLRVQDDAHLKREQAIAMFDLLNENTFAPVGHDGGPYRLELALVDRRLVMTISLDRGEHVVSHHLSLTPFRRLLKDYTLVCDSFYDAVGSLTPEKIEAIDMGRRGIHNEAAELLQARLLSKVTIDIDTARRLFTLIHVLLMRSREHGGQIRRLA